MHFVTATSAQLPLVPSPITPISFICFKILNSQNATHKTPQCDFNHSSPETCTLSFLDFNTIFKYLQTLQISTIQFVVYQRHKKAQKQPTIDERNEKENVLPSCSCDFSFWNHWKVPSLIVFFFLNVLSFSWVQFLLICPVTVGGTSFVFFYSGFFVWSSQWQGYKRVGNFLVFWFRNRSDFLPVDTRRPMCLKKGVSRVVENVGVFGEPFFFFRNIDGAWFMSSSGEDESGFVRVRKIRLRKAKKIELKKKN